MLSLSRRSTVVLDFLAPSITVPANSRSSCRAGFSTTCCSASSSQSTASTPSSSSSTTRVSPASSQPPRAEAAHSAQTSKNAKASVCSRSNKGSVARAKPNYGSKIKPTASTSNKAAIPSALALLAEIRASVATPPAAATPAQPTPSTSTSTSVPFELAETSHQANSSTSTSPFVTATKTSPEPILDYNKALQNLIDGTTKALSSFRAAFLLGWLPIRRARMAGQLQPKDLAKVLEACASESRRGANSQAVWSDVKELLLYLYGSSDPTGVTGWAWRELQLGISGADKVVELWDSILNHEYLQLRSGPNSLDHRSMAGGAPSIEMMLRSKAATTLPSGALFHAYVVARSMLSTLQPDPNRPSFSSFLPSLIGHPLSPLLASYRKRAPEQFKYNLHVLQNRAQFANASIVVAEAQSWTRQVMLAQLWYLRESDSGLGLVARIKGMARRSGQDEVAYLWEAVVEGVEKEEVAWIETNEWSQNSRKMHASVGEGDVEREHDEEQEAVAGRDREEEEGDRERAEAAAVEGKEDDPSTSQPRTSFPRASLTPAIVAPFITVLTRAKDFDGAGKIWSWIPARGLSHNVVTYTALIRGYAQRNDLEATETVYSQMKREGIQSNVWIEMERVGAYFANRDPQHAINLFDTLSQDASILKELPDKKLPTPVWGQVIRGLLVNKLENEAMAIVQRMEEAQVPFTVYHANNLLKYYANRRPRADLAGVSRILRLISEKGIEADVFTYTMMLQALLDAGQKDSVAKLVSIMESGKIKPTTTTYGSLIHHLANSGDPDRLAAAVDLIDEMEQSNVATNEIIYTSVIQGFLLAIDRTSLDDQGAHPYFITALNLKARMHQRRIPFNRIGYNAIISAAMSLRSKWGVELAMETFREMQNYRPNANKKNTSGFGMTTLADTEWDKHGAVVTPLDTWYILIDGFVKMDNYQAALALLREMQRSGIEIGQSRKMAQLVTKINRGGW
ncbi:BQ2448_7949 [Microbotryum intermedium]|uniref:BQ2448_7949 protein n=1 Tax=Microbotryum intermedium TaxID=269621 RepID=A0A238FMC9_9BASI|nr:BQ2448_7949 [Microbotryum intermedium]